MTAAPAVTDPAGDRWEAHPGWARALRILIRLGPVSMAVIASWLLSRALPSGSHRWLSVGVLVVASIAVGVLTERLARRLIPLSSLLALTMLFPDQAPSRWKVARSARQHPGGAQAQEQDGGLGARSLALLSELTSHDRRTRGHAERVRVFAEMLGEELRLGRDDQDRLRWAALLHDVGKIEVAASLLNKPGKPTGAEWQQLREHPAAGARLAGPLVEWLGEWGPGIAEHHERFDGTGYPRGLAGTDISRAGRALAVVDAYEVMTAARSYKKPMHVRKARAELTRCAGTHFDPVMVRAFLAISLPRLLWTTGPLSFLANLPFLTGLQAATRALPLATAPTAAAGVLAAGAVVGGIPAIAATPAPAHPTVRHARLVHAAVPTAPASTSARGADQGATSTATQPHAVDTAGHPAPSPLTPGSPTPPVKAAPGPAKKPAPPGPTPPAPTAEKPGPPAPKPAPPAPQPPAPPPPVAKPGPPAAGPTPPAAGKKVPPGQAKKKTPPGQAKKPKPPKP